ncbi:hypothetical protein NPIL_374481 [Nephila pilipes]|uniref:Uncharacterized protein n=1 Tax=Nephila pilipes TaxID=299642 RepID=A0A8X6T9Z1_NEPPI|nr:hypothetical protein NPIL_374481 [Nephila pilipes]
MAATYSGPWILWALTLLWSAADSANPHYFVSHPDHRVAPGGKMEALPTTPLPEEGFRRNSFSLLEFFLLFPPVFSYELRCERSLNREWAGLDGGCAVK